MPLAAIMLMLTVATAVFFQPTPWVVGCCAITIILALCCGD